MGHGKETPRQKMIGLMYLFLTAMLALNVSKEVLNSFIYVGDSLEKTVENYKSKNDKVYNEFDKAYMQNQEKVGPWKTKADEVRKKTDELVETLENDKVGLAKYAEGDDTKSVVDGKFYINLLDQKDNIDKGGEYFGELGKKHGVKLKEMLEDYQKLLLGIIPESETELTHNIETTLETKEHVDDEGVTHTWVSHTFEHIPLIADFVMLAQLQTNVKNMETDVINYLYTQISAGDFKVNKMEGTVIAKSSYVMVGGEYSAKVFIAASDSTQDPEIYVGDFKSLGDGKYEIPDNAEKLEVKNGKGIYTKPASSVGDKKWGGLIKLKSPDGGESYYPFHEEYKVAQSNVVISPTGMNVFYYGIANPAEISVPGIAESDITPRIPEGATITKVAKGYEVKPTKQRGNVSIQVYANIDGTQKLMGSREFRIKVIPAPQPKIMGKAGGTISKAYLQNAPGVYAELEDFVFNLKYEVTKFTVVTQDGIYFRTLTANGTNFTADQRSSIAAAKRGSRITIEDIEARGPDGRTVPLSSLVFKIN